MGFEKIVLLGIDGNYREIVDGAKRGAGIELEIVEDRPNPNYFFEGYQKPGDRYNIPNPRPGVHTEGWAQASALLEGGRTVVVNANPSSAVEYFPYIDLPKALGSGSPILPAKRSAPQVIETRVPSLVEPFVRLLQYGSLMLALLALLNLAVPVAAFFLFRSSGTALAALWLCGVTTLVNAFVLRFRGKAIRQLAALDARISALEHLVKASPPDKQR
ncbi:MAG: hypothetical protein AAFR65_15480 [Pseudomonadota bacterium]